MRWLPASAARSCGRSSSSVAATRAEDLARRELRACLPYDLALPLLGAFMPRRPVNLRTFRIRMKLQFVAKQLAAITVGTLSKHGGSA